MELELLIWTFIVIICYTYLVDVIRILQMLSIYIIL